MRIKLGKRIFIICEFVDMGKFVVGLQSTSFCNNGGSTLFLDYDDKPLDDVVKECISLQLKEDLPTFYVYQSSKKDGTPRYNAFCFAELPFKQWSLILWQTTADFHFKTISLAERKSTLRFSGKSGQIPQLLKVIRRKSNKYPELENGFPILEKLLAEERRLYGHGKSA